MNLSESILKLIEKIEEDFGLWLIVTPRNKYKVRLSIGKTRAEAMRKLRALFDEEPLMVVKHLGDMVKERFTKKVVENLEELKGLSSVMLIALDNQESYWICA
jgi:hypothetical protein